MLNLFDCHLYYFKYLSDARFYCSVTHVVEELDRILAFNNKLVSLKNHADAGSFARGVGLVSLVGKMPHIFWYLVRCELYCIVRPMQKGTIIFFSVA